MPGANGNGKVSFGGRRGSRRDVWELKKAGLASQIPKKDRIIGAYRAQSVVMSAAGPMIGQRFQRSVRTFFWLTLLSTNKEGKASACASGRICRKVGFFLVFALEVRQSRFIHRCKRF